MTSCVEHKKCHPSFYTKENVCKMLLKEFCHIVLYGILKTIFSPVIVLFTSASREWDLAKRIAFVLYVLYQTF